MDARLCFLYFYILKKEMSFMYIQPHACKSHVQKLTVFLLVILSEWRLTPPTCPPLPTFSCERRISLQPNYEVATVTAGPCATVDVLWPLHHLHGSWGRPLPWQHGHLTLAPHLPSAFLSTKTFRRHRCCCTRLLKKTNKQENQELKKTMNSNYRQVTIYLCA